MTNRQFKKHEVIFYQGDYAPVMYDIVAGSVGVYSGYGTKKQRQIATLGPGQVLGEMGVIEAYPRSADAVALEDGTELREIADKEFADYFKDQPERVLEIMRQLSQRLRRQTEEYEKALGVLEETKLSSGKPVEEIKTLRDKIRYFLKVYAEALAMADSMPHSGAADVDYPYYPYMFF